MIWSVFGGATITLAIHALEFWTEKSFTHISLTGNNYNYRLVAVVWDFEFYILKCKNFSIGFLDELANFKQKNFYTSKCKILHFEMSG